MMAGSRGMARKVPKKSLTGLGRCISNPKVDLYQD
jgi:hypothetical protein